MPARSSASRPASRALQSDHSANTARPRTRHRLRSDGCQQVRIATARTHAGGRKTDRAERGSPCCEPMGPFAEPTVGERRTSKVSPTVEYKQSTESYLRPSSFRECVWLERTIPFRATSKVNPWPSSYRRGGVIADAALPPLRAGVAETERPTRGHASLQPVASVGTSEGMMFVSPHQIRSHVVGGEISRARSSREVKVSSSWTWRTGAWFRLSR